MTGSGGFQTQAYNQPVMAIAGDFASNNPYWSYDAGPGGLVAGSSGVIVGNFAWVHYPPDSDGTPSQVYNAPGGGAYGPPNGFVHRAQQALITTYLADASLIIPPGFPVTIMAGGDFWVVNNGATDAQVGQKVFAAVANGQASMATSGTLAAGVIGTSATAASTAVTSTASITGNVMTVIGQTAGGVYPGATVASPGVGTVVAVLTGTPTATSATYLLSVGEQSVTTTQIVTNYSILTVPGSSGTQTVPFAVGDIISGGGIATTAPLTVVTYVISATGSVNQTVVINTTAAITATSVIGSNSIETRWWVQSTGLPGELVKITDHGPQF